MSSTLKTCIGYSKNNINKQYLQCKQCTHNYDINCAKISEGSFNMMHKMNKNNWICI